MQQCHKLGRFYEGSGYTQWRFELVAVAGDAKIKPYITVTLQQHVFTPAPAGGVVYAGLTPRPRPYKHANESLVVEINQTTQGVVVERLLTGKQAVFNRLGSRSVDTVTYVELLPVETADLAAMSTNAGTTVSLADVENVVQRLFIFAAGAWPLGNASTRVNCLVTLSLAQAVCAYFGPAIRDFFRQASNQDFLQRLDACIDIFSGWTTGACVKNSPLAPVTGLRRFVPVGPVGAAAAPPTPRPTSLYMKIRQTAAMDVYGGLHLTLHRDAPSGPAQPLPGSGGNADYNTVEEDGAIAFLDGLQ